MRHAPFDVVGVSAGEPVPDEQMTHMSGEVDQRGVLAGAEDEGGQPPEQRGGHAVLHVPPEIEEADGEAAGNQVHQQRVLALGSRA